PGGTRQRMPVRQHAAELLGILRIDVQRAHAVAVETEVLVARISDQGLGYRREYGARAIGVFVQTVAQALIGKVDDRQYRLARQKRGDLVPLRRGIVDAGGIVAA